MGTIIEELAELSVDVNGVIVPGRSLHGRLMRHTFCLVVHNDDPLFKVSLIGSATAVRYRDKYILLCTAHQLKGVDPQRVSMLLDDGSYLITSAGFRSNLLPEGGDANDFVGFDFTEPVAAHPDLGRRFFELREVPPPTIKEHIMAVLLTGFPSKRQLYELEDKNHLGFVKLNIVCEPDELSNDPALMRVRPVAPLAVDPDGMSGGSAFMVHYDTGRLRAYFSGIIVRGGRDGFYILHPGLILQFLRSW